MEESYMPTAFNSDPRTSAFNNFAASSNKQRFDVRPSNVRFCRFCENCFQRFALPIIHACTIC